MPEAIEARADHILLRVRVQPRASRNEVTAHAEGLIRVALTAPPVEGAANKALEAFLAATLGVPKRSVQVVSGAKSREKAVRIEGLDKGAVWKRLGLP